MSSPGTPGSETIRVSPARQRTAGAPPIGLTIGSAPAGSRAILRRLSLSSANGT